MKQKSLFILAVLVLITTPALAGHEPPHVDLENNPSFGSFVVTKYSESSPGPVGFVLSITATVWLDDAGTYTYVYEFSDIDPISGNGTSLIGISSLSIGAADFDSSLHWGAIGDLPFPLIVTFGKQLTFQFPDYLPSGGTYTVYAQSTMGPLEYPVSAFAFGPSGAGQYTLGADPVLYVAEAPSLLFLITGLLGVVGIGFFRQKFS